jgi:hypothetical protein
VYEPRDVLVRVPDDMGKARALSCWGRELPINFMDFDEEIGVGTVGFEVDEDAEPLQLLNGKAVRVVSINYVYDEVIYASTSRQ